MNRYPVSKVDVKTPRRILICEMATSPMNEINDANNRDPSPQ